MYTKIIKKYDLSSNEQKIIIEIHEVKEEHRNKIKLLTAESLDYCFMAINGVARNLFDDNFSCPTEIGKKNFWSAISFKEAFYWFHLVDLLSKALDEYFDQPEHPKKDEIENYFQAKFGLVFTEEK